MRLLRDVLLVIATLLMLALIIYLTPWPLPVAQ